MDAESFTNDTPIIREMGRKVFGTPSMLMNAYFILVTIIPVVRRICKVSFVPRVVEQFFTGLMKDAMDHRKINKTTRVDYLEYLIRLQQEKGLSNLDLAAHSMTFFLDGFETSSIFISHALCEVCGF
jgi:cytochrome P450